MSLIHVNSDTCNRDGICVAECPMKILVLKDRESVPEPVRGAEALCIDCGHCVAVCPTGALSHRSMSPDQCPPVRKEWLLSPEQAEYFLRSRRSIRTYRKKPVDREILRRLISMAAYAPSGHNLQPVRWQVVYETDELRRLTGMVADWMRYLIKEQPDFAREMHMDMVVAGYELGMDVICRGAPHLVIAHAPASDLTAQASCTIALTYLELAALPLGLGACWAGFFHAAAGFWPPLQKALGLPEGHTCMGAMMVGYPKYTYHRLPLRKAPKITWK